jgi:hypothetical protein
MDIHEMHFALATITLGKELLALVRAIAQMVSRWLPTATAWVHARSRRVGFVVDKMALEQVFSEYFSSPSNHHSTKFSILVIIQGRYSRSFGGRRAEWTRLDSAPHYSN